MRVAPPDVVAAAQTAQKATGILSSVQIGQWALESSWGSKCTGRFNFFGVKSAKDEPFTLCWTHEFVGGKSIPAQQPFVDYPSLDAAFMDHAKLLTGGRYYAAWTVRDNLPAFVHAIAPIYATDPDYGDKLLDLIRQEGFVRYDLAPDDFGADLTQQVLAS